MASVRVTVKVAAKPVVPEIRERRSVLEIILPAKNRRMIFRVASIPWLFACDPVRDIDDTHQHRQPDNARRGLAKARPNGDSTRKRYP